MHSEPVRQVAVSVIVCARNREASIGRCLKSILAANPAEVIVVDGRSSDRTVHIARQHRVTVVSDDGAGLGAARQIGAALAGQDFVAFVDSDTIITPTTLRALLDEAHDQGYDAVQAHLLPTAERPSYWEAGESWRRSAQEPAGIASALGCQATLVRRTLVTAVTFDRAFEGAAEDGDFFYRARRAGATLARSSRAIAYHEDRASLPAFVRQRFWHGRGLARMAIRHGRRYADGAREQASSAKLGIRGNLKYLPFMVVSTAILATGMAMEAALLACNPRMRKLLLEKK